SDLGAAYALRAQRCKARAGGFFRAENPQRDRPAMRSLLLDDEILADGKRLQLGGLLERSRAAARLRRYEHPPAGRLFRAALADPRAQRERLECLLGARRIR